MQAHHHTCWPILRHFEAVWSILKKLSRFWIILSNLERFWAVFWGQLGSSRAILSIFVGRYGIVDLGQCSKCLNWGCFEVADVNPTDLDPKTRSVKMVCSGLVPWWKHRVSRSHDTYQHASLSSCGGFHTWWYPNSWMVLYWKIRKSNGWFWGYPYDL